MAFFFYLSLKIIMVSCWKAINVFALQNMAGACLHSRFSRKRCSIFFIIIIIIFHCIQSGKEDHCDIFCCGCPLPPQNRQKPLLDADKTKGRKLAGHPHKTPITTTSITIFFFLMIVASNCWLTPSCFYLQQSSNNVDWFCHLFLSDFLRSPH